MSQDFDVWARKAREARGQHFVRTADKPAQLEKPENPEKPERVIDGPMDVFHVLVGLGLVAIAGWAVWSVLAWAGGGLGDMLFGEPSAYEQCEEQATEQWRSEMETFIDAGGEASVKEFYLDMESYVIEQCGTG